MKDYQNTINTCSKYLSLQLYGNLNDVTQAQIYSIEGEAEKDLLQFDKAIIDLKRSIQLGPFKSAPHKELAECYYFGYNDIKDAMIEVTKAIDINSAYYQAYYLRERLDRNSKPPLVREAESDSASAEKFDSIHSNKPDAIYATLEKSRRSVVPKVAMVQAYYDSLVAIFHPNKILQQKVIDAITADLKMIEEDSAAIVEIKSLQKLTNDAIAGNELLLKKLRELREVDSTIGCKQILIDYENLFRSFMIGTMPVFFKILNQENTERLRKEFLLLEPPLRLIQKKGKEFYNSQEALMDKYTLH
jgi:tetratricopeptide (TPR) repeat protein